MCSKAPSTTTTTRSTLGVDSHPSLGEDGSRPRAPPRIAVKLPAEFWFPDAARYYLQAQGFEVSVLENNDAHIRLSAARELVDVRTEIYVTMKTQHLVGLRDTASPLDPFKAEIRVLRYLRDPDGGWAAADPEPLRGLAEELAQVIKTGSRG